MSIIHLNSKRVASRLCDVSIIFVILYLGKHERTVATKKFYGSPKNLILTVKRIFMFLACTTRCTHSLIFIRKLFYIFFFFFDGDDKDVTHKQVPNAKNSRIYFLNHYYVCTHFYGVKYDENKTRRWKWMEAKSFVRFYSLLLFDRWLLDFELNIVTWFWWRRWRRLGHTHTHTKFTTIRPRLHFNKNKTTTTKI